MVMFTIEDDKTKIRLCSSQSESASEREEVKENEILERFNLLSSVYNKYLRSIESIRITGKMGHLQLFE